MEAASEIQSQIVLIVLAIAPHTVLAAVWIALQTVEAITEIQSHKAPQMILSPSHSKARKDFRPSHARVIKPYKTDQAEENIVQIACQALLNVSLIVSQAPDQSPPSSCSPALKIPIKVHQIS